MLQSLNALDDFSEEAFEEIFKTFDEDGSGTVEPEELSLFLV